MGLPARRRRQGLVSQRAQRPDSDAGAVRSNAGIGIRHRVNSGDEDKRKPAPAGLDKARALPNGSPTVEIVPGGQIEAGDFVSARWDLIPRNHYMWALADCCAGVPSPRKVAVTLDHCVRSSPPKGLFGYSVA